MSHLHPDLDELWQRPLDSFDPAQQVWYYAITPVGITTLNDMMSRLSEIAQLSKRYTNHCIRGTAISALDEAGFPVHVIMQISGHKSESSIKSYASRMTDGRARSVSAHMFAVTGGAGPSAPYEAPPVPRSRAISVGPVRSKPPSTASATASVADLGCPDTPPVPKFEDALDMTLSQSSSPLMSNSQLDEVMHSLVSGETSLVPADPIRQERSLVPSEDPVNDQERNVNIRTKNRQMNFAPVMNNCVVNISFHK